VVSGTVSDRTIVTPLPAEYIRNFPDFPNMDFLKIK